MIISWSINDLKLKEIDFVPTTKITGSSLNYLNSIQVQTVRRPRF